MAEQIPKRILVVDDARLVRSYYRSILAGAGYEVEEALNGVEALEKLVMAPPDLLIVDINMPKMDGMTFLQRLRLQPDAAATTPAMVTSTEAAESDKIAARAAGANFYLVKPLAPDQLLAHVALLTGRETAGRPA